MDDIWGKYFKIETINSNAISDIYKGKNRTTKEYVSIKEIKKIKVNDSDKLIKNEIEIIKQLNSENTLLPIETIESLDSYFIVSEIYNMTLEEYIKKRKEPLSLDEIKEILFELNKLFKSMNEKNIIHGNLNLSNILITINKSKLGKLNFKIANFGLNELKEHNFNINPETISPEVLKRENISLKSDIWSLGIIIYYLLFKEYPFNGSEYNIINQIESNKELKSIYYKELDDLIKKILKKDINERISWDNYFQHSFFNNNTLNQNDFPLFNYQCNIHFKDYNSYCSKCKKNICESCLNDHSSNEHKVIVFSKIGLSENEIKQFENSIKQIENNLKKINDIKKQICDFLNQIKVINENSSSYENDNDNNYKYYSIQCLNLIKEKIKIEGNINLPKIQNLKVDNLKKENKIINDSKEKETKKFRNKFKWELRYIKDILICESKIKF